MTRALIILCVTLVLCVGTSANAEQIPGTLINIGNWNGGAYTSDNGAFSHCALGATYRSGIYMVLSLGQDGTNWAVAFANPQWNLQQGSRYHVRVFIDRLWKTEADVYATTNSMVALGTQNRDFMSALQVGRVLTLQTENTQLRFELVGTDRVIRALEYCVYQQTGAFSASNPFGAPNGGPQSNPFGAANNPEDNGTDPGSALTYVSSLLNSGKIEGFHLISAKNLNEPLKSLDVAWAGNDAIGGLKITGRGVTLELQQQKIISDDTLGCAKGSFASGAKNQIVHDVQVRRIFTACANPDGTGFFANYSLYPLKVGGFYIISNGAPTSEEAQAADDAFFRAFMGQ